MVGDIMTSIGKFTMEEVEKILPGFKEFPGYIQKQIVKLFTPRSSVDPAGDPRYEKSKYATGTQLSAFGQAIRNSAYQNYDMPNFRYPNQKGITPLDGFMKYKASPEFKRWMQKQNQPTVIKLNKITQHEPETHKRVMSILQKLKRLGIVK